VTQTPAPKEVLGLVERFDRNRDTSGRRDRTAEMKKWELRQKAVSGSKNPQFNASRKPHCIITTV
jgi:hypothetical protein